MVWKASCLKLKSKIVIGRRRGSEVVSDERSKKRKKSADDILAFRSCFADLCRRFSVTEALVSFLAFWCFCYNILCSAVLGLIMAVLVHFILPQGNT